MVLLLDQYLTVRRLRAKGGLRGNNSTGQATTARVKGLKGITPPQTMGVNWEGVG